MGERTSPSRDLFEAMEAAVPYIAIGMHEEMKRMAENQDWIEFAKRLLHWLAYDSNVIRDDGLTVGMAVDYHDEGGVDFWFPYDYEIDDLVERFVQHELDQERDMWGKGVARALNELEQGSVS